MGEKKKLLNEKFNSIIKNNFILNIFISLFQQSLLQQSFLSISLCISSTIK